jgi:hypothetical protein
LKLQLASTYIRNSFNPKPQAQASAAIRPAIDACACGFGLNDIE